MAERYEGSPRDRQARLGSAMTEALAAHHEYVDGKDRCAVFLSDGERGVLTLYGYDDDLEAFVDVLYHLQALARANGKELQVHALGGKG